MVRMEDVSKVTAAYAAMNPWARKLLIDVAAQYAKRWPAPKPQLSLVPLHSAQPPPDLLDNDVDGRTLILVRKTVNRQ